MAQTSFIDTSEIQQIDHTLPALSLKQTEILAEPRILFKELNEEDEIIEMFALRSLVYQYVGYFPIAHDHYHGGNYLDIDCFDLYSTFLGAFQITQSTKRLIGTVRIISHDTVSEFTPFIRSLYKTLPGNETNGSLERSTLFPYLESFKTPLHFRTLNSETINAFESGNHSSDTNLYEISRLAVLPEFWKSKEKVAFGLHVTLVLNSWEMNPRGNHFIIATHPKTKKIYENIGFSIIQDTGEQIYKSINQPAILMEVNLEEYFKKSNPYCTICSEAYLDFLNKGYFELSKYL